MRGRVAIRSIAIMALVLILAVAPVAADNDTPAAAVTLSAANPSATGTLPGNGSFRYYRFAYQGGYAQVIIHLTWNPGWQATDAGFGFNVYGPNGEARQGGRGSDVGEASTRVLTLETASPGEYLLQVYNYAPDKTSAYTVDVWGLAAAPETITVGTSPDEPGASPQSPAEVRASAYTAEGTLLGSSDGAFHFFYLDYPGGGTSLRLSLGVTPSNVLEPGAYGFNVYEGGDLIASGDEVERTPTHATKTATVSRMAPGTFGVQVYNYRDGVTASYTLGVDGAAGPVVGASDNDAPERALELSAGQAAFRGSLPGNGSFAFYGLNYQEGSEPITLVLGFTPGYGITGDAVGFNVFRGADLVATAKTSTGATADRGMSTVTFSSDEAGYYGVQVFNYLTDTRADYSLYALGFR